MSGFDGFGRFSEPAVLVLVSLASGAKHGYAIQDDVAALTGRRPGPGTLYGAIRRLEGLRLIAALSGDERRKPYEITQAGQDVLRAELSRMQRVAAVGLCRLATS